MRVRGHEGYISSDRLEGACTAKATQVGYGSGGRRVGDGTKGTRSAGIFVMNFFCSEYCYEVPILEEKLNREEDGLE